MRGLELARDYFETYGAPMLHAQFPDWEDRLAVGLVGSGSECLGYDDEVSQDHDFEPGFCIFLPEEDVLDRRTAFQLERAYAKLPAEFEENMESVMQKTKRRVEPLIFGDAPTEQFGYVAPIKLRNYGELTEEDG